MQKSTFNKVELQHVAVLLCLGSDRLLKSEISRNADDKDYLKKVFLVNGRINFKSLNYITFMPASFASFPQVFLMVILRSKYFPEVTAAVCTKMGVSFLAQLVWLITS